MGELFHASDAERSRVGFQRVERAKHLGELLPITRHELEGEDARLDGAKVLEGLGKEGRGQLGIAPKRRELRIRRVRARSAGGHQNCPKVPVSADAATSAAEAP